MTKLPPLNVYQFFLDCSSRFKIVRKGTSLKAINVTLAIAFGFNLCKETSLFSFGTVTSNIWRRYVGETAKTHDCEKNFLSRGTISHLSDS